MASGRDGAAAAAPLLGFVYDFDGTGWWRAEYEAYPYDGFRNVGLPALTLDDTREHILWCYDDRAKDHATLDQAAVDAMIAADGEVTEEQLRAVVVAWNDAREATAWDPAAGAAADRKFLQPA